MRKKEKGSQAVKPSDPKRLAEAKRLLHSKQEELKSPEAQIFLKFMETYPLAREVSLNCAELLWSFLVWLRSEKTCLVDEREIFCFPFSKLVRKKDLK